MEEFFQRKIIDYFICGRIRKVFLAFFEVVFMSRTHTPLFLSVGRMVISLFVRRLLSPICKWLGILSLGSLVSKSFLLSMVWCLESICSRGGYFVGGFQFGFGSLKGLSRGESLSLKKCLSLRDLLRC